MSNPFCSNSLSLSIVERKKKRYFIELAFKGTQFHGWQIQKNATTIQELLNKILSTVFRENIETIGCGRTDAGVHAKQFFAHFDVSSQTKALISSEIKKYLWRINSLLPSDIAAIQLFLVNRDAHARFDALSRRYEYHIHFAKDPFLTEFSWQHREQLDLMRMNKAAQVLLNHEDFSCFSKSNTQVFTNLCTVTFAQWKKLESGHLIFEIEANRFLRNMVRAIVGTLIEIGKGKEEIAYIERVIESKSRSRAGVSVPAHGLYLSTVIYPEGIVDRK